MATMTGESEPHWLLLESSGLSSAPPVSGRRKGAMLLGEDWPLHPQ